MLLQNRQAAFLCFVGHTLQACIGPIFGAKSASNTEHILCHSLSPPFGLKPMKEKAFSKNTVHLEQFARPGQSVTSLLVCQRPIHVSTDVINKAYAFAGNNAFIHKLHHAKLSTASYG